MKMDWKLLGKTIGTFLKRRSPEILTGIGIAGMGVSVVMAVKATPKAQTKLHEDPDKTDYTKWEVVKKTWKCYIPCALTFTASASCIIFASHTNFRRNAALAAACTTTENMLREYKDAAKEVVGERKEEQIRDKAAKNTVSNNPPPSMPAQFIDTKYSRFFDPWTGKYFYYDIDEMKHAIEDISYQLRDEEYVTYNDFYDRIGQDRTRFGDFEGWNANDGAIRHCFSATIADDGTPCVVLGFTRDPRHLEIFT